MVKNIIYSDNFKRWFGDWENNPSESSKIVDDNGFPMLVYHGSETVFNEFKSEFMGKTGTACGQGFYFTNDKSEASYFGKNVKTFFLNIRKPLSDESLTITSDMFRVLLDSIDKKQCDADADFGYGILSDYGDVDYYGRESVLNDAVEMEMSSSDNDVELIGGIVNATNDYDLVMQTLRDTLGYDGVIIKSRGVFVAHHPNQIKEYTNTKFNSNSNNMYENRNRKIFVTEKQYNDIKNTLLKEAFFADSNKVLIVKKYLDKFFEKGFMDGMNSNGYPSKTRIFGMKNNSGEVVKNLSIEQMLDLLEDKFHYIYVNKDKRELFLRQVLKDWTNNKISKEGLLSINQF